MYSPAATPTPHTTHRNVALTFFALSLMSAVPALTTVRSCAFSVPRRTSKYTVFASWFTIGTIHASLPLCIESVHLLVRGICAPHAGLGHVTVRAQSQAITVASPPPYSFGSCTFG